MDKKTCLWVPACKMACFDSLPTHFATSTFQLIKGSIILGNHCIFLGNRGSNRLCIYYDFLNCFNLLFQEFDEPLQLDMSDLSLSDDFTQHNSGKKLYSMTDHTPCFQHDYFCYQCYQQRLCRMLKWVISQNMFGLKHVIYQYGINRVELD